MFAAQNSALRHVVTSIEKIANSGQMTVQKSQWTHAVSFPESTSGNRYPLAFI
jgi:hypothetical protein